MKCSKIFLFSLMLFNLSASSQTIDLKDIRKKELTKPAMGLAAPLVRSDNSSKKSTAVISTDEKSIFLQKNIPSVIGSSGMAPAHFDNLNLSFGDDKLSFTSGFFTDKSTKKNSYGFSLSAEAPNGSRTIFQPGGKTPFDFGIEFKYTNELSASKWFLVETNSSTKAQTVTNNISSVSNKWLNFSFSANLAKHILFSNDTLNYNKNPFTFEAFVNFNYLFNSFIVNSYVKKRVLTSIGAGFGRFTNYTAQDEINLRKGIIYNNSQLSETEVVSGRKAAAYKIYNGLIVKGAIFKPLTDPFALSQIHLGATMSSFGAGSSNHLLNGTAGVYFSKWKKDETDDTPPKKILKESFSVGLIADFRNLQNSSDTDYMKDNFKIVLSAQIPLSFF